MAQTLQFVSNMGGRLASLLDLKQGTQTHTYNPFSTANTIINLYDGIVIIDYLNDSLPKPLYAYVQDCLDKKIIVALKTRDSANSTDICCLIQSQRDDGSLVFIGGYIEDLNRCHMLVLTPDSDVHDTLVPTGDPGPEGPQGPQGEPGLNAHWFTGTAIDGTGTDIFVIVPGSNVGDMYLNTSTQNVYTSTGINVWKYVCNIKGATGADGTVIINNTYTYAQVKSLIDSGKEPVYTQAGWYYSLVRNNTNQNRYEFVSFDGNSLNWADVDANGWNDGGYYLVDQTYSPSSIRAQSGTAVAQALALTKDASWVTTGTFDPARTADNSIEPIKLKYKKELAVDNNTIVAEEVGDTVTLVAPKVNLITATTIYTLDTNANYINIDVSQNNEYEDVRIMDAGTYSINLTTSYVTDCHALIGIQNKNANYICSTIVLSWIDETLKSREIELDGNLNSDETILIDVNIKSVPYNNIYYAIARINVVGNDVP